MLGECSIVIVISCLMFDISFITLIFNMTNNVILTNIYDGSYSGSETRTTKAKTTTTLTKTTLDVDRFGIFNHIVIWSKNFKQTFNFK